jgi:hypothetical protein
MMMKGPVREIIPITKQRVSIRLLDGKRIAGAKLLVSGTAVPHHMEGRMAVVEVPSVAVHEVLALDLT